MNPSPDAENPFRTDTARVVARLRFRDGNAPQEGGELRLLSDACVLFAPAPGMRERFDRALGAGPTLYLFGGVFWASMVWRRWASFYGGASAGTRQGAAFMTAGGVALLGAAVRRGTQHIGRELERRRPLAELRLHLGNDGCLTVGLFGRRLNKILFTISPDEFDAGEAAAFIRAVEAARHQK